MSFRKLNEQYGKLFLILATLIVWAGIFISFKVRGYDETWELWKVPVEHPQFLDFRVIPGSADTFRKGIDPSLKNPGDPAGRIFNLPAFWRLFFYTSIDQTDTVWIVLVMFLLYFMGVFAFPMNITILDSLCMLLVIFSPAAMLLYERGNVDMSVFFLCAMVVFSIDYSTWLTSVLLMLATVVKLYPFFGITVLLKEEKKSTLLISSLLCFGMLLSYLYATSKSVAAVWNATQRGNGISYGTNVLFFCYQHQLSDLTGLPETSPFFKYVPMAIGIAIMLVMAILGIFYSDRLTSSSPRNLAAFRMGASIYIGTFLLGNNWDYRLVFLILTLPQLLQYVRDADVKRYKILAGIMLLLVLASCWHFRLWYSHKLESVRELIFVMDETFNWTLFAGFGYMLFASLPAWLVETFPFFFSRGSAVRES